MPSKPKESHQCLQMQDELKCMLPFQVTNTSAASQHAYPFPTSRPPEAMLWLCASMAALSAAALACRTRAAVASTCTSCARATWPTTNSSLATASAFPPLPAQQMQSKQAMIYLTSAFPSEVLTQLLAADLMSDMKCIFHYAICEMRSAAAARLAQFHRCTCPDGNGLHVLICICNTEQPVAVADLSWLCSGAKGL